MVKITAAEWFQHKRYYKNTRRNHARRYAVLMQDDYGDWYTTKTRTEMMRTKESRRVLRSKIKATVAEKELGMETFWRASLDGNYKTQYPNEPMLRKVPLTANDPIYHEIGNNLYVPRHFGEGYQRVGVQL